MSYVSGISENRGVIEISLDGRLFMKVRRVDFAALRVSVGDDLNEAEYVDRLSARQLPEAYEAALTMLDRSARTAAEIERKLIQKGFAEPAVRAVVEKLTRNRLLNDKQIASRLTESVSAKNTGAYVLKRKLRARGISEDDAEEALRAITEEDQKSAARKTASQLYRKYESLPKREARAKLSQALARRGFAWDIISEIVEETISE